MTEEQETKCHIIIHGHAVAAGGGNAVPIPGLGVAVDTTAMFTMAAALASVFGANVEKAVLESMAINALKQTMLRQPIKVMVKEASKYIPGLGSVIAATISVGMIEATGWALASQLENLSQET